jgi:hypothetical protein
MKRTYGKFELEMYTDGHPHQIYIKTDFIHNNKDGLRVDHTELRDLKHLIDIAMRESVNALPDKYKNEV